MRKEQIKVGAQVIHSNLMHFGRKVNPVQSTITSTARTLQSGLVVCDLSGKNNVPISHLEMA